MPGTRIGLDNPAFAGRTKLYSSRRSTYERRSVVGRPRFISDIRPAAAPKKSVAKPLQSKPAHHPTAKPTPGRLHRSQVLKRQGLVAPKMRRTRQRRVNLRAALLTSFASVLFIVGLGVGGLQFITNHKVKVQVAALAAAKPAQSSVQGDSTDVPSEESQGSPASHKVGAQQPRVLRIQKLGVEARVMSLGVDSENRLKAPDNIFDIGWFNGSALPGSNGAVLLDGHVHGPTKPGVFVSLKKLKAGDKMTIERGDGKVFTYRVVKSQSYKKDAVDMGAAFSSVTPGKPGLNLITCDGSYDAEGHYDSRLIVFAVQE
jgi:LPXTG-site transpeptidase (sortase) family protein